MSGGRNGQVTKLACIAALVMALSGCVQATRHSNAIVFGTNTSLGIKVGPNATSVPSIVVGFDRQEAVFLPLVANTNETADDTTGERLLTPCNVGNAVTIVGQQQTAAYPIHPCLLVATNRQATDAYSVLASFGSNFGATARPSEGTVQGGLAQYFSTGMAAQLLATTGGASVVSASAPAPGPGAATAPAQLFGSDADRTRAVSLVNNYATFRSGLVRAIGAESDATIQSRFTAFENKISPSRRFASRCLTVSACLVAFSDPNFSPYSSEFALKPDDLNATLATWATN